MPRVSVAGYNPGTRWRAMKPAASPPPPARSQLSRGVRGHIQSAPSTSTPHVAAGTCAPATPRHTFPRFPIPTSVSGAQIRLLDRTLREPEVRALRSLSDAQIDAFVTVLRDLATVVAGRYDVALVARDPADNPVLACALEGGAGFVVTDDRKHLLPLKVVRLAGHAAVQIVSPGAFVRHHLPPRRR